MYAWRTTINFSFIVMFTEMKSVAINFNYFNQSTEQQGLVALMQSRKYSKITQNTARWGGTMTWKLIAFCNNFLKILPLLQCISVFSLVDDRLVYNNIFCLSRNINWFAWRKLYFTILERASESLQTLPTISQARILYRLQRWEDDDNSFDL